MASLGEPNSAGHLVLPAAKGAVDKAMSRL
jgi:hypothetical protein